jgi:hypothetical protein
LRAVLTQMQGGPAAATPVSAFASSSSSPTPASEKTAVFATPSAASFEATVVGVVPDAATATGARAYAATQTLDNAATAPDAFDKTIISRPEHGGDQNGGSKAS